MNSGQYEIYEPVIFTKQEKIMIGEGCRFDSFCKIEGGEGVDFGKCIHIASFCHVNIGGGRTVVEDYATFASGAKTISGSATPDSVSCSAAAPLWMQVLDHGTCIMRRFSFLTTNAVMLPNSELGEGAILGVGSVLMKGVKVPAWEIWAGIPARKIGSRRRASERAMMAELSL